jgi:hypothetical protein
MEFLKNDFFNFILLIKILMGFTCFLSLIFLLVIYEYEVM